MYVASRSSLQTLRGGFAAIELEQTAATGEESDGLQASGPLAFLAKRLSGVPLEVLAECGVADASVEEVLAVRDKKLLFLEEMRS